MNGKGDRNRVTDWEKFYDGYNRVFRPKEPFHTDIKEYESRFRGGKIDSIQEGTSEDVGANPTSSTIENTDWIKVCFAVPLLWQCTSRVHKRWLGIRRTSDWNVGKENP